MKVPGRLLRLATVVGPLFSRGFGPVFGQIFGPIFRLIFGLVLGLVLNPGDSAARPITLEDALARARENAPEAIQAAGQLRTSRASVRSAYGAFLPSVSVSAGTSRRFPSDDGGTRVEDGQVITLPNQAWSYSTSIGASLELFSGGRRFFDLRQAKAGKTAAEAGATSQLYLLDLAVKREYFAVLATRESEIAARAQLEQTRQQLVAATLRVKAGSATLSDSLRSEIQVRNAELALLEAQNDLAAASASLTRVIGAPELVTASTDEPPDPGFLSVDDAELVGLAEAGPLVRQAEAELDAARAAKSSAWTDYLPSVSASYSRGGSGAGGSFGFGPDDLDYSGSLRFSLSLPLFDRFGREEQVVRAAVGLENAEAQLRDARLAAREELTRSRGALRVAEQRVLAQVASVEAAEEDLRVQEQRYAVGNSTILDILTSQALLNAAREALIRARYDQRIARAELEALVGRDL